MTVNHFFIVVALILAGIFFGFRPVTSEAPQTGEIAQLDLRDFTVYELDEKGLIHVLHGAQGQRFADRYEVRGIAYVDNSEAVTKEMSAEFGRAREATVDLVGNVVIRQNDGSEVRAEDISYDKEQRLITSQSRFTIRQGGNRASGEGLYYKLDEGRIRANNISAVYTIPEEREKR